MSCMIHEDRGQHCRRLDERYTQIDCVVRSPVESWMSRRLMTWRKGLTHKPLGWLLVERPCVWQVTTVARVPQQIDTRIDPIEDRYTDGANIDLHRTCSSSL